jgi:hypothetical protein
LNFARRDEAPAEIFDNPIRSGGQTQGTPPGLLKNPATKESFLLHVFLCALCAFVAKLFFDTGPSKR